MPTQSEKAQSHENRPMKRSRDIYGILKKKSKLPAKNIEILFQKQKIDDIFSSSHDMIEYMNNYLK